jgi:hypothetical protein
VLEGDRLVNTPYSIKFRVDKENEILCSRELTEKDLKKFRKAVKKDYYFQVCMPFPVMLLKPCNARSVLFLTKHDTVIGPLDIAIQSACQKT